MCLKHNKKTKPKKTPANYFPCCVYNKWTDVHLCSLQYPDRRRIPLKMCQHCPRLPRPVIILDETEYEAHFLTRADFKMQTELNIGIYTFILQKREVAAQLTKKKKNSPPGFNTALSALNI